MTGTFTGEPGGALRGQVAIVTGATVGIGRAITETLARHGADIAAIHRQRDAGEELASALAPRGTRLALIQADLTRRAEVATIVPQTVAALGRVDILVNNAAVQNVQAFLDQTADEWDEVLEVNLTAAFVLCQHAGRQMIQQGQGGRIVNLSSSSAFRATLTPPAYVCSKGAVGTLTRSAAGALGPYGILVNAVAPGLTVTRATRSHWGDRLADDELAKDGPMANLLGRVAQPEDVADVVAFLCLPMSRNVTGQVIHASSGAIV